MRASPLDAKGRRSALIVLKLGGSLLTEKGAEPVYAEQRALRLARELADVSSPLVLVHGTGSFGKPPARKYGYLDGVVPRDKAHIVPEVAALLLDLRSRVLSSLRSAGLPVVSLDSLEIFHRRAGAVTIRNMAPVAELLDRGLVPVLSGALVVDQEGGFAVASSDVLAALSAVELGASRLIFGTDSPGVVRNGDDDAPIDEFVEGRDDLALLIRADDGDVSGGMAGKLRAGLAAARAGIDTLIVDGRVPGRLAQTLAGYEVPVTKLRANLDS